MTPHAADVGIFQVFLGSFAKWATQMGISTSHCQGRMVALECFVELIGEPMSSTQAASPTDAEHPSIVDVSFPLWGKVVPRDHGYLLYAAICRLIPQAHEAKWLSVHPLAGRTADALLLLPPRAFLTLRVPATQIHQILPLAGTVLRIGEHEIGLGPPNIYALRPASNLVARQVVIRLTDVPKKADGTLDKEAMAQSFLRQTQRQLAAMSVRAEISLGAPRQVVVNGRRVLGFTVRLAGLSDRDSLQVQTQGLGGKRTMGCGVFGPSREASMAVPLHRR